MSLRKYASLENGQVLDTYGSKTRVRHASLGKLADFEKYRTEDGYLYARIRAISSRVNKNHDGWPSIELAGGPDVFDRHTSSEGFTLTADSSREYGFSTFLGKPIFVDHHNSDPSRARGVIVDAKLHVEDHKTSSLDPYYSSKDVDQEHLPGTWIELLLEVDAKQFPKFAKAIIEGGRNPNKGIDGWSMGCDVEKSVCSICKNAASAPEDYCQHIRMKGAIFDYIDKDGHKTSKRAYENCYGVKFFEISGVFDPADETALSAEIRTSSVQEKKANSTLWAIGTMRQNLPQEEQGKIDQMIRFEGPNTALKYLTQVLGIQPPTAPQAPFSPFEPEVVGNPPYQPEAEPATQPAMDGVWSHTVPAKWLEIKAKLAKSQEETVTQDPKERSLKDGADDVNEEYLDDTIEGIKRRKKSGYGLLECPNCAGDTGLPCGFCDGNGYLETPNAGGDIPPGDEMYPSFGDPRDPHISPEERGQYGPVRQGNIKTAENPPPQSELLHAPEKVDTLRKEEVCPVCGSSMDEDTCEVCGFQEPPDGFGNPDLTKAQDVDVPVDGQEGPDLPSPPNDLNSSADSVPPPVNTPNNPALVAHVTDDMDWDIHKTAARINKIEKPLVATNQPQTNEPNEKILSDQSRPVTSQVRTAEEFIAAARRNEMNHTADAASGAPAVAKPDVHTDVVGVGGVADASNEAASKADAQVDVLGIGSTGEDSVAAEQEGVNVDQGDEHSKNIEAIPTKTWSGEGPGNGDSLGQHDPVTSEPFPASEDGVRASHWVVEGHDDAAFPGDEIGGGTAVQGVQPVTESFGDRVNVLEHVTSPSNNSGPTKTWTGTDGNGVLKQQDPVTTDSIARGESGLEGAPNWTSSTHIFAAFKLADLEVELGLLPAEKKYERAAELEKETPQVVAASLDYAKRVKKAAVRKTAGTQRLPVMGKADPELSQVKSASTEESPSGDDSFMFGA